MNLWKIEVWLNTLLGEFIEERMTSEPFSRLTDEWRIMNVAFTIVLMQKWMTERVLVFKLIKCEWIQGRRIY